MTYARPPDAGFPLAHMNGRVYDPQLGRFLSADPGIQFPKTTQGFNRYAYVNNNPLSFTDPSGFSFGTDKDGNEIQDDGGFEDNPELVAAYDQEQIDIQNRRNAALHQGRVPGKTYLTEHEVCAACSFDTRHTAIEHTPTDTTQPPETLSAEPDLEGKLRGKKNRKSDAPKNNSTVAEVEPPEGKISEDVFNEMKSIVRDYCNCHDYDAYAGATELDEDTDTDLEGPVKKRDGYSSNGFSRGLVEKTGSTAPIGWDGYPGGRRSVPF